MVTAVREAIDELYLPLTTAANAAEWLPSGAMEERKPVPPASVPPGLTPASNQ